MASFRLFQRQDHTYLRLPLEQLETVRKRLSLYILRAKVHLENASEALMGLGLSGPNAEDLLQQALGLAPVQIDQVMQSNGITVIRVPGLHPRFEIYAELEVLQHLWTALTPQTTPAAEKSWRLLDILAGIPTVYSVTQEAFIPQMVNLQLINGVSFQKGCYTGQEIVARTQHLGKLKRRMYLAQVSSTTPPQPGDSVYFSATKVGTVVDASPHPDGGCVLLVVVPVDKVETNPIRLNADDGPSLQFHPLPYDFAD